MHAIIPVLLPLDQDIKYLLKRILLGE